MGIFSLILTLSSKIMENILLEDENLMLGCFKVERTAD